MNKSQSQKFQNSTQAGETSDVRAGMRAVSSYGHETGHLTGVTLTRCPPRDGASIGLLAPRPDLDAALPPLPGWHWWEGRGEVVCELAPTTREVLAQVARDIARGSLDDYRRDMELLADEPLADQLRETATRRMSLPPDEAEFQCARLLREYQGHVRRIEADDEG